MSGFLCLKRFIERAFETYFEQYLRLYDILLRKLEGVRKILRAQFVVPI